ncbi:MAG: matrixin family metalloprotease [Gemmataceae bacterium]
MHETGHALGLADSSDPHSVMVSTGGNINLDSNDYSSIQALYGVRTPDRFDAFELEFHILDGVFNQLHQPDQ